MLPCVPHGGAPVVSAKNTMPPEPECLAMIVCDDVTQDKNTGKKTLFNTFNQIACREFPNKHGNLVVFVSLTNGRGEAPMNLEFIRGAAEQPLCALQGTVKFPDPLAVVDVVLRIAGLPLPEEGVYAFRLTVGGRILRERRIFVSRQEGGKQ